MSAVTLRYETSDTDQRDTGKVLTCKQSKNKILIYVVFRATLHECLSVSLLFWRSQAEGFLSYF